MLVIFVIFSIVFVESVYLVVGIIGEVYCIEYKLFFVLILVIMSIVNLISIKVSISLNNFFVLVKFLVIFGIVLVGFVVLVMYFLYF